MEWNLAVSCVHTYCTAVYSVMRDVKNTGSLLGYDVTISEQ